MFDLTGKVVLLTGATGGIGKSIAKRMKEKGYSNSFIVAYKDGEQFTEF